MNFLLLTGAFEGEIVSDGQILDVPFEELDEDLKDRIVNSGFSADDVGKEAYESAWDSEETSEPVTLQSLSQWGI